MARAKPHKYGYGWRLHKGVTQRTDSIDLMEDYSVFHNVADFAKHCQDKIDHSGLEEVKIKMNVEDGSYGDRDRDYLAAAGWRMALPDEIAAAEAEYRQREMYSEIHLARAERELREARPELFKDDLVTP